MPPRKARGPRQPPVKPAMPLIGPLRALSTPLPSMVGANVGNPSTSAISQRVNQVAAKLDIPPEELVSAGMELEHARRDLQRDLEQSINDQFDGSVLDLFDAYGESRQKGAVTRNFLGQLNRLEKHGEASPHMTQELVENLYARFPGLDKAQRTILQNHGLTLLTQPRPGVRFQAEKLLCGTTLSLYSFSSTDTGPYFSIQELYRMVDNQLVRLGGSWGNSGNFPRVHNPVYRRGMNVPEFLDYSAAQRIYKWYHVFREWCGYLTAISPTKRKQWEVYDVCLLPEFVRDHDRSWMTKVYETGTQWASWLLANQLFVMIVRNLLCIGVMLFIAYATGQTVDSLTFLTNLLLGQFLQNMLSFLMVQGAAIVASLKNFGPVGEMLSNLLSVIRAEATSPGLMGVAVVGGLAMFGSGWIAGLALLGAKQAFFSKIGVQALGQLMLKAAGELYQLFVDGARNEAGTLSNLFAIHGVRYVCRLMGYPEGGWCEKFADQISTALQGISVGVMIFDIIADIRFASSIYSGTNPPADLTGTSNCIRAIYQPSVPDFLSAFQGSSAEAPAK